MTRRSSITAAMRAAAAAAYNADENITQGDVARMLGISRSKVSVLLGEAGARDPEGKKCCADCGLCWTMRKPIFFVRH